jgi:broad specificity phosphatase PhoE
MDIVFIRHGHGEHLYDYPNRLNTLHPGLTDYGRYQVKKLAEEFPVYPDDLVVVSPTRRTIETAQLLYRDLPIVISPLVGPRMFPQHPDLPFLDCDRIYSQEELAALFPDIEIVDFDLDCWAEGINRIEQQQFECFAQHLIDWCMASGRRTVIIAHDGTITSYRGLLGESGLTRSDFLGEAGVYTVTR